MPSRLRGFSDVVIGLLVLAVTALLLVPLPTWLLDILLSINLCISLLVLLVGLYTPNALAMLSFPSILLLTTLFRLSLNVASARLILTRGNAGTVIDTFGTFLISGQVMVGLIIFTIITIVNFIVISRGASRVSEVAARFALDSLPGKQMAIDADLRAGSITREEAERRREQLRQESQLYGSMDGAMKFVQGDAIAGVCIIFINIIGGLSIGLSNDLSFAQAVEQYTRLTVGDGLVTQIPALMISICAGIVVTRVSSFESTTLGSDIGSQLFKRPGVVFFSGLILGLVGLVPGLPHLSFLGVGAVFMLTAFLLSRRPNLQHAGAGRGILPTLEYQPNPAPLLPLADRDEPERPYVEIALDSNLLYRVFSADADRHTAWWREVQQDCWQDYGLRLPEIKVVADDGLHSCAYAVNFNRTRIDEGRLILDSVLIEANPEVADVIGIPILAEERHPLTGARMYWASQSSLQRRVTLAMSIRALDFMQFIMLRAADFFLRHPEDIFTLSDVHFLLKELEKRSPGLLQDALGAQFVSLSRLTEILQELVREGVSIREFRGVVESVAAYCSNNGLSADQPENFDLHDVVAFVRLNRKRQLIGRYLTARRSLKVVTLSEGLEQLLQEHLSNSLKQTLAPETFEVLRQKLAGLLEPLRTRGINQACLICRPEYRVALLEFLRLTGQRIGLLTFDELEAGVQLEPVGMWGGA